MFYLSIGSALIFCFVFYRLVSQTVCDEMERRFLERDRFCIAITYHMIDQIDTVCIFESGDFGLSDKRPLFLSFSQSAKLDVIRMIKERKLGFAALAYVAVFFLTYYPIILKSTVSCQVRDIKYLSALPLMIWRQSESAG